MTLAILKKGNDVLLGYKKRGLGKDLWNGFGGKLEQGETPEEALSRECQEEIGITPTSYKKVADINFYNQTADGLTSNRVYIYVCTGWQGEPIETDEMKPQWFSIDKLPFNEMWDADGQWMPRVLNGERLCGLVVLDRTGKAIDVRLQQL